MYQFYIFFDWLFCSILVALNSFYENSIILNKNRHSFIIGPYETLWMIAVLSVVKNKSEFDIKVWDLWLKSLRCIFCNFSHAHYDLGHCYNIILPEVPYHICSSVYIPYVSKACLGISHAKLNSDYFKLALFIHPNAIPFIISISYELESPWTRFEWVWTNA